MGKDLSGSAVSANVTIGNVVHPVSPFDPGTHESEFSCSSLLSIHSRKNTHACWLEQGVWMQSRRFWMWQRRTASSGSTTCDTSLLTQPISSRRSSASRRRRQYLAGISQMSPMVQVITSVRRSESHLPRCALRMMRQKRLIHITR